MTPHGKIVLTGATGFLGSHLLRKFISSGREVIVLKRSFSDISRIASMLPAIKVYDIDRGSLARPFDENNNITAVVHAATLYGRKQEPASEVCDSNVLFPLRILECAASSKVPLFINSGTILTRFLSFYALSKDHFLEWATQFSKKESISFVNIELEHAYGPDDAPDKFVPFIIQSCLSNKPVLPLTKGEQRRDFVHIDDVVQAFVLILENATKESEGVKSYQVGSGQPIQIREFVELVHRYTRSTTRLDFGALEYRENEVMLSKADTTALSRLGWTPKVPLTEGLKKLIKEGKP